MDEEKWNRGQEQQGPLGKTSARHCDFTAVANRSFNVSLIDAVNANLLRIRRDSYARKQRIRGVVNGCA